MTMKSKKLRLGVYGALGAFAPDILILHSKVWTMPAFTFSLWQYSVATALYVSLGSFVATIFPYRQKPSNWKAFCVGVALPTVISGIASLFRGQIIEPRGAEPIVGDLLDLISLF